MKSKEVDRVLAIVGDNIRAERARAGLRQQDVAERASLGVAQFARIERGETNSSLGHYARIAKALGVPLSTLTDRVE